LQFELEFISLGLASVLYGVTLIQTLFYYGTYDQDPLGLKLLVALLCLLDTAHLIVTTHMVYYHLITMWGNPAVLDPEVTVWSLKAGLFLSAIIALVVQSLLILRIWRVSKRHWLLTGYLSVLSLISLSASIAYAIRVALHPRDLFSKEWRLVALIALGNALLVDVSVSISLVYLLRRSRTGIESTNAMIHSLVKYIINTGLLTSSAALVHLVLSIFLPASLEFLAFYVVISKLYTNTLMGTLNARKIIRGRGAENTLMPPVSEIRMHNTTSFHVSVEAHEFPLSQDFLKKHEGPIDQGTPSNSTPEAFQRGTLQ